MALWGCGAGEPQSAEPLFIGAVLPLTGPESERGTQVLAGMKLAISLVRTKMPVEVRAFDVEDSPTLAARRLESLALDPQVIAVVTGWSAATARAHAADPRRENLPTVLLSPLAFPKAQPLDPSLIPLHRLEALGSGAARFAREELDADRAVVVENPRWESSRVLTTSFEDCFTKSGGYIVKTIEPDLESTVATKTRRPPPPSEENIEKVIAFSALSLPHLETLLEDGVLAPSAILFPEGWAPPTNDLPSSRSMPGYVISFSSEDDPSTPAREFRDACERAGLRPTDAVAFGWDAARVLLAAIEDGATTRDAMRSAVHARSGFEGATGRILLRTPADSAETPAVSAITPSGWVFQRRIPARPK
ncbi:MAG TPA: ABC transporter substrate-binding protein [bacterium]|nr:ABC transporter substrate-binding protein [bacterium]